MNKRIILGLLVLLLMSGCSNAYLSFSGESDHWKGEYSTTISDGKREDGEYVFRYKTDDPKAVPAFKNLKIVINDGKTKRTEENYSGSTVKIRSVCSGCWLTPKNESIKVSISWDDDQEETFMLEPKKQNQR